jgi:hypothetical protein
MPPADDAAAGDMGTEGWVRGFHGADHESFTDFVKIGASL